MSRRLAALVPLVLVALVMARGFWGFSYDDNFITYRYARNVLDGQGLVYNPGERVLGTSAPGYALLLAGLAALTGPLGVGIPQWGTLLTLASILAVAGLLAAAAAPAAARSPDPEARRRAVALPVVFGLLALTSPLDLHLAGSEAFPVLALLASAAWRLRAGADRATAAGDAGAGLLAGAAMALRLDAGLAALALGIAVWASRRRFPAVFAATGLGALGTWLVFLRATFGRVVPNTLGGKTALAAVAYSRQEWRTLTAVLPTASGVLLLAGAVLGLALLWRRGLWRNPAVAALAAWLLAHEIVYRAIGVWYAPWYHLHLWHALLALFALAVAGVAARIGARLARPWSREATYVAVIAVLAATILVPSVRFTVAHWGEPIDPRYRVHEEAARYARENVDREAEVLTMEIGVFGYFGGCRILDLGALVSPRFTEAKFSDTRPQLVAELRPAYILADRQDRLMRDVLAQEGIRGRYSVVARFRGGGAHLRLWRRHEAGAKGDGLATEPDS